MRFALPLIALGLLSACGGGDTGANGSAAAPVANVAAPAGQKWTDMVAVTPEGLQLRGDAGRVQFLDAIELQPLVDEVRVRYVVEYHLTGLSKVATPLAKGGMEKVADDAAEQMAKVLADL